MRSLFRLDSIKMLTKLSPYVCIFLEEASKLFDMLHMYIYTMGECSYALEMARLLDPGEKYSGSKVIAREDCTRSYQKGLDVVLGKESVVLILDDRTEVWAKHKENLIVMERYNFFALSRGQLGFDRKSLSELKSETNRAMPLASTLDVLKQIHIMYLFDSGPAGANLTDRDVREMLRKYWKSCSTRPSESLTRPRKNRLSRGY
ncbi:hypothetical protein RHMOL_Rhmol11G0133900 [Rhododendron molle]|uniref:Uncharacterized protein n=1 Tax=Rhododendron molle TaxID=49168 RepID=A0ACC0LRX2_RHOML|nr:hypothetical protein RHMOL_Rhmol11G0133900 [Rhododendron molle]